MSIMQISQLGFQLSVVLSVFAIGLATSRGDLVSLFRRPLLLAKSLVATNVIMLAVAVILVKVLHLPHLTGAAVVAMALAPMPPVLPKSMIKAGGEASYASGLLALIAVLSLVWIPLAVEMLEGVFHVELDVPMMPLLKLIATTILIPLIAGSTVARLFPRLAAKIHDGVATVAGLLLAVALVVILAGAWRGVIDKFSIGVFIAIVVFVASGLMVGHLLGGPRGDDRTVLALACAQRHPAIIILLGKMAAPDEAGIAFVALMMLLVSTIGCLPYIAWRKRPTSMPGA